MSGLLTTLATILLVVVFYVVAVKTVLFVTGLILYARDHGYTLPFIAGGALATVSFLARERPSYRELKALTAAALMIRVAATIQETTDRVLSTLSSDPHGRSRNPPPVLAPLKKSELEMPTEPPRRVQQNVAPWPPFTGVRVELGGDQH